MKKYLRFLFLLLVLQMHHAAFTQATQQLIGFTSAGGVGYNNSGIMYKVNPDGSAFTPIYSFVKATGYNPSPAPMINTSKNVNLRYSMCQNGGAHDSGCIFSYDVVKNKYTDLFDFSDSTGGFPKGGLILATNGLFYGVTFDGGKSINGKATHGTLFSFDPGTKAFRILIYFNGADLPLEMEYPSCTLLQAKDGKLYGTTQGSFHNAILFSFNPVNNAFSKVETFYGPDIPPEAVVQDNDGTFYGSSTLGMWKFNPVTKSLFYLNYEVINVDVYRTLTFDLLKENLWGTSYDSIFYIRIQDSSYHLVFTFSNQIDGGQLGPLINRNPNNYYGVGSVGGVYNHGILYHYYPQFGGYEKLHDFTGSSGGSAPYGQLTGVACTQHPAKPGSITGKANVNCNKTYKYSIKSILGTTSYIWAVPAGATIQGATTDTAISVLWGSTGGDITVQASNTCGTSGKQTKTITVTCSAQTSITSDAASGISGVTPNPTTGNITIHFTSNTSTKYTISVVDVTGKILLTHETDATIGNNIIKLDLSKFAKGMYYVQLKSENDTRVFKLELQ